MSFERFVSLTNVNKQNSIYSVFEQKQLQLATRMDFARKKIMSW